MGLGRHTEGAKQCPRLLPQTQPRSAGGVWKSRRARDLTPITCPHRATAQAVWSRCLFQDIADLLAHQRRPVHIPARKSVSSGRCNKFPQTRRLQTTEVYCPPALEARSPRLSYQQGWFFLEDLREKPSQAPLPAPGVAGGPWCPLACGHIPQSLRHRHMAFCASLLCVSISNLPLLSFIRTSVTGFRAPIPQVQDDLNSRSFTLLYLQRLSFQTRSLSEFPGGHEFWEDTTPTQCRGRPVIMRGESLHTQKFRDCAEKRTLLSRSSRLALGLAGAHGGGTGRGGSRMRVAQWGRALIQATAWKLRLAQHRGQLSEWRDGAPTSQARLQAAGDPLFLCLVSWTPSRLSSRSVPTPSCPVASNTLQSQSQKCPSSLNQVVTL